MNTLLYVILTFCSQANLQGNKLAYNSCVAKVTECSLVFGAIEETRLTRCIIKEAK